MIRLEIRYEDGQTQYGDYLLPLTIGRHKDNGLAIRSWRVAKSHAQLIAKEQGVFLEDLGALSGTLLDGKRIFTYGPLQIGDQIIIGPCLITIKAIVLNTEARSGALVQEKMDLVPPNTQSAKLRTESVEGSTNQELCIADQTHMHNQQNESLGIGLTDMHTDAANYAENDSGQLGTDVIEQSKPSSGEEALHNSHSASARQFNDSSTLAALKNTSQEQSASSSNLMALEIYHRQRLHSGLLAALDLRRINVAAMSDEVLRTEVQAILERLLREDTEIGPEFSRESLKQAVLHEAVGLGPLEVLLKDPSISEIMVNRFDEIYIEQSGRLSRSKAIFSSEKAVLGVIDRIVSPLGRRIDEGSPMVDARLKDGSRVNAVIPPIALRGASITIRKFASQRPKLHDLINLASLDKHMAQFLSMCVENRMNIIVSGGTGSGKTTLLNILSNCIPERERIVTIEDAAELRLNHEHLVSLEARPENLEGKGLVQIRDLVRNALRMRPDRIVVGECRGAEAFDMLSAMNTGHRVRFTLYGFQ